MGFLFRLEFGFGFVTGAFAMELPAHLPVGFFDSQLAALFVEVLQVDLFGLRLGRESVQLLLEGLVQRATTLEGLAQ